MCPSRAIPGPSERLTARPGVSVRVPHFEGGSVPRALSMDDAGVLAYETITTCISVLREWDYWEWSVVLYDGFAGSAAQTEHITRTIYFSVPFMLLNPHTTWNTMMHELAHAATGFRRNMHDDVWRNAFMLMGGNGEANSKGRLPEPSEGAMHTNYETLLGRE